MDLTAQREKLHFFIKTIYQNKYTAFSKLIFPLETEDMSTGVTTNTVKNLLFFFF